MRIDPRLVQQAKNHACPLLFATISGAHLYGFPSPDSDFDLRGVHVLPIAEVVGLSEKRETLEQSGFQDEMELDLVTHDVAKFMGLMLKRNGYVLEQLLSPLVVLTTPEHEELKALAPGCITKHHGHHYLGFASTQWKLFAKEEPPRIKPLLYVYRVLLTGIHLVRTGRLEANLNHLQEEFKLPYIPDLVNAKVTGQEKSTLSNADLQFHEQEYLRLVHLLEAATESSNLPQAPTAHAALNDLLVRVRLANR